MSIRKEIGQLQKREKISRPCAWAVGKDALAQGPIFINHTFFFSVFFGVLTPRALLSLERLTPSGLATFYR